MNIQKYGQRARMLPMARQIWPAALQLQSSTAAASNALSRYWALSAIQTQQHLQYMGDSTVVSAGRMCRCALQSSIPVCSYKHLMLN